MDKKLYTMIVYSENIAGLLNQITAVFTRRQINIESLNVSASSIKGVHKYTITAWTDEETIKKIVRQIEKKIDVLQAHYFTDEEIFAYEIALYKLSTPVFEREPKVSELIRRYHLFGFGKGRDYRGYYSFLRRVTETRLRLAVCAFGTCRSYKELCRAGKRVPCRS